MKNGKTGVNGVSARANGLSAKAVELRTALKELFERISSESASHALDDYADYDAETIKCFDSAYASIDDCIEGTLKDGYNYTIPSDSAIAGYRELLEKAPYRLYEAWMVREGISDAEIIAAESAIRGANLKKLAAFRDERNLVRYNMPLRESFARYRHMMRKLQYLMLVYAHKSKHFGSFAAGTAFLRAVSLLRCDEAPRVAEFCRLKVDEFFGCLTEGLEEFKIAADYHGLEDWAKFSKVQLKANAAAKAKGAKRGRGK